MATGRGGTTTTTVVEEGGTTRAEVSVETGGSTEAWVPTGGGDSTASPRIEHRGSYRMMILYKLLLLVCLLFSLACDGVCEIYDLSVMAISKNFSTCYD